MTVADQRILRGTAATLTWQPLGSDGEIAAPADPVTVQVNRADGTELLAAGTATSGSDNSPRSVVLPATDTQYLDLLTVVWTDADDSTWTTYAEIVGGFYFTIAEARASDPALSNDTKYPTPALIEARNAVELEIETICGVAFVPRFTIEVITGRRLTWPQIRRLRNVSSWDGITYDPWTDITYLNPSDQGVIYGLGCSQYRVEYEHGYDRPPADIKAAALVRLRHRVSAPLSGIPDKATTFSVAEGGTYGLMRAGIDTFGIDDVDSVLARHVHRSFVA